jgi:hypothetical protein
MHRNLGARRRTRINLARMRRRSTLKVPGFLSSLGCPSADLCLGRGLILTEDKEGFEFTYDMLTGLRATVRAVSSLCFAHPSLQCSRDHRATPIRPADFEAFRDIRFPSQGSASTPPHSQRDFKFADFAPVVFGHIRAKFGIDPIDYLVSGFRSRRSLCRLTYDVARTR